MQNLLEHFQCRKEIRNVPLPGVYHRCDPPAPTFLGSGTLSVSLFSDVALEAVVNGASHAEKSGPRQPNETETQGGLMDCGPYSQQGSFGSICTLKSANSQATWEPSGQSRLAGGWSPSTEPSPDHVPPIPFSETVSTQGSTWSWHGRGLRQ